MGTVVSIHVVNRDHTECVTRVARAFDWMREVEQRCTRFDLASEVMQLAMRSGEAIPVSDLVYEAVRFAVAVAAASEGAFDPTIGLRQEGRGFNREYQTGALVRTALV